MKSLQELEELESFNALSEEEKEQVEKFYTAYVEATTSAADKGESRGGVYRSENEREGIASYAGLSGTTNEDLKQTMIQERIDAGPFYYVEKSNGSLCKSDVHVADKENFIRMGNVDGSVADMKNLKGQLAWSKAALHPYDSEQELDGQTVYATYVRHMRGLNFKKQPAPTDYQESRMTIARLGWDACAAACRSPLALKKTAAASGSGIGMMFTKPRSEEKPQEEQPSSLNLSYSS